MIAEHQTLLNMIQQYRGRITTLSELADDLETLRQAGADMQNLPADRRELEDQVAALIRAGLVGMDGGLIVAVMHRRTP